jgi:hypothetical protein
MRAELLALNQLLEKLPAMAEQTDRDRRDHERELNDLTNKLTTEHQDRQQELADLTKANIMPFQKHAISSWDVKRGFLPPLQLQGGSVENINPG